MKTKKLMIGALSAICILSMLTGCHQRNSSSVSTDGSTSMEQVIGALKETFEADHKDITVTYNPTGSGSGITAVADGSCDIGLSSRDLKEEEKARGLVATVLAYDGIAIIVHPDNPVSDLDIETLAKMYTGEITNWQEVGGHDASIVLIGREAGSGTRDGFEAVTKTSEICQYRQELTSTGDVMTAVAGNPDAIGYVSLASLKDSVKTLRIEGILPSDETIRNGSYRIQRPFILVTRSDKKLSESAQIFFDYITSKEASDVIASTGVVPAQ